MLSYRIVAENSPVVGYVLERENSSQVSINKYTHKKKNCTDLECNNIVILEEVDLLMIKCDEDVEGLERFLRQYIKRPHKIYVRESLSDLFI